MTGSAENGCSKSQAAPQPEGYASFVISRNEDGQRLDHFLTAQYPEHSRSLLNKLISAAHVVVDGQQVKAGHRLRKNETISIFFPAAQSSVLVPEQVDFTVLYEDDHILVINKPPGLVVHPAAGHATGTLVHGLLYRCVQWPEAATGRPGIVHRLDKDTSGVLLVAKTEQALRTLMADFKGRKIRKTYHALLLRSPREGTGRIVAPLGRHPVDRKKMAVRPVHGKYAATNWQVIERFANGWCLAEIGIETGRTHQIRVHMASIKAPVAGDLLYGGAAEHQAPLLPTRQMLHASTLSFRHPFTGQDFCCNAPLGEDMETLLARLRQAYS